VVEAQAFSHAARTNPAVSYTRGAVAHQSVAGARRCVWLQAVRMEDDDVVSDQERLHPGRKVASITVTSAKGDFTLTSDDGTGTVGIVD
jgi:hypothetical protein